MGDMALTYVLDMDNELIKIGHTESIRDRIRTIQNQSGFAVLRHHETPLMPKDAACQLENTLHGIFAKCRANGEFFRLSYEEACAALDKHAVDFVGNSYVALNDNADDVTNNQELSLREKIKTLLECAKLTKDAKDRQRLLKIIRKLTLGDQLDFPTLDADEKLEDIVEGLIYRYCGFDKKEAVLKYDLINKLREDERIGSRYSDNVLHEMICRVDGITFEPRHYYADARRGRQQKSSYVGVFLNDFVGIEEDISSDIAAFLDVPIPHKNIWAVMTKTERRKFFEHNCFEIEKADCDYRIRALKRSERDEALATAKTIEIQNKAGVTVATRYRFYGVCYRMETCATEIANEYYGSDARKMIYRVNEALNEQVEGWQLATSNGKPQQPKNFAGVYGNQKRIFKRIGEPPETVTVTDNDDDDFFDADDEVYAES